MRRDAGFTLVEMLTVLAIVALLAALYAGGGSMFREPSLDREADKVAAALRLARTEALTRGEPVELRFDAGEGVAIPQLGWQEPLSATAMKETGDEPASLILFDSFGRPSTAGVRLVRDDQIRRIGIDVLTGRVDADS